MFKKSNLTLILALILTSLALTSFPPLALAQSKPQAQAQAQAQKSQGKKTDKPTLFAVGRMIIPLY